MFEIERSTWSVPELSVSVCTYVLHNENRSKRRQKDAYVVSIKRIRIGTEIDSCLLIGYNTLHKTHDLLIATPSYSSMCTRH